MVDFPVQNRLFHQVNIAVGFAGLGGGGEHSHGIEQPEEDVFERGAWWKNKALSAGLVEAGQETSRTARAVSLYLRQARSLNSSLPSDSADSEVESPGDDALRKTDNADPQDGGSKRGADDDNPGVGDELNMAARLLVSRLKTLDAAVRAHEMAHRAVGGGLIRGAVSYQYRVGPDGERYAVGGDVAIDTSTAGDPEETIRKMEAVRAAALAPAVPSSQDRRVAAMAALAIQNARRQILESSRENTTSRDGAAPLRPEGSSPAGLYVVSRSEKQQVV